METRTLGAWPRALIFLAGLMGAAGVAAAAAAAHVGGGANLETASHFLLFHAAAVVAIAAAGAVLAGGGGRVALLAGASLLVIGTVLFSGDLAMRALMDQKLLFGTAPFGGSLSILGWLAAALGGLFARAPQRP